MHKRRVQQNTHAQSYHDLCNKRCLSCPSWYSHSRGDTNNSPVNLTLKGLNNDGSLNFIPSYHHYSTLAGSGWLSLSLKQRWGSLYTSHIYYCPTTCFAFDFLRVFFCLCHRVWFVTMFFYAILYLCVEVAWGLQQHFFFHTFVVH